MVEHHPLRPFLPPNAKILMLGSFPPPQKRWSIPFFYPNLQNDMWRIFGLVFFEEKEHFVLSAEKKFNHTLLESFLKDKGVALYDTATVVDRTKDNAADQYLEVVKETDVEALLSQLPHCRAVVATGGKSAEILCGHFSVNTPKPGTFVTVTVEGRSLHLWRMPSSSRAYPLALGKKTEVYVRMFREEGLL